MLFKPAVQFFAAVLWKAINLRVKVIKLVLNNRLQVQVKHVPLYGLYAEVLDY